MRTLLGTSARLALSLLALAGCSPLEGKAEADSREPFRPDSVAPYQPTLPAETRRLVLLHTNDEHSHLLGFGPNSQYPYLPVFAEGRPSPELTAAAVLDKLARGVDASTVGGLVRRQFLVNRIREGALDPVLLLSAGDSMMGTLFALATATAAPDYVGMGMLGYDFATLGNHDFDLGVGSLVAALRTANTTLFGAAVPIVSSNLHFDGVAADDSEALALAALVGEGDSGAAIVPWATRSLANGLKVGVMGLMGYEAALVAPAKGSLRFSAPRDGSPCHSAADCDGDEAGFACTGGRCTDPLDAEAHVAAAIVEAQAVATHLREVEQVDVVVLLSHQGLAEDSALAAATLGIDVIIGGHSHDEVPPTRVGDSLLVQAGQYGAKLGRLVLTVDPDGNVGHEEATSGLLDVDARLDAEILAGSVPDAEPPVLSKALASAVGLTCGLVGTVLAGLDAELVPALQQVVPSLRSVLAPVAVSTHPILGERAAKDIPAEVPGKDTNLAQLVTDAARAVVKAGAGLPAADFLVAVQANGVLRDSLYFGAPEVAGTPSTSFADLFRVLPLGASPFEASPLPGYPVVVFKLSRTDLYRGLEIGVGEGMRADSFFLAYSGLRLTFDPRRAPPASFDPTSLAPQGRVTRIELVGGDGAWVTVFDDSTGLSWSASWTPALPATGKVIIVTNLYLAGFLAAFGLTPLDPVTGGAIAPLAALGSMGVLAQTVLCRTQAEPPLQRCFAASAEVPWALPELKEWAALLQYVADPMIGLAGAITDQEYAGEYPASPRVVAR